MSRRSAAWLCVLLAHALAILLLLQFDREPSSPRRGEDLSHQPIMLYPLPPEAVPADTRDKKRPAVVRRRRGAEPAGPAASAGGSAAGDDPGGAPPARIDWSLEGEKSAARLLDRQEQAGRDATRFSGPRGTWPSLTQRPPPAAGDFRWKEGIDEPEYDAAGRRIFRVGDRCQAVTSLTPPSLFVGCTPEKPTVHGDLFDGMKQHFDEQRLPDNGQGNGTEPEAQRPAN
jgi:hypothetical protein